MADTVRIIARVAYVGIPYLPLEFGLEGTRRLGNTSRFPLSVVVNLPMTQRLVEALKSLLRREQIHVSLPDGTLAELPRDIESFNTGTPLIEIKPEVALDKLDKLDKPEVVLDELDKPEVVLDELDEEERALMAELEAEEALKNA